MYILLGTPCLFIEVSGMVLMESNLTTNSI